MAIMNDAHCTTERCCNQLTHDKKDVAATSHFVSKSVRKHRTRGMLVVLMEPDG